jgi:hypothetical protein
MRPGFDRSIMPLVGLTWAVRDDIRLEAQLPESRLSYFFRDDWYAHAGFEWRNLSYRLREKGFYDRDMITVEDFRLSCGLTHRFSDELRLTAETGSAFSRSVEFKDPADSLDSGVDVEDAVFLRVTLGGPF